MKRQDSFYFDNFIECTHYSLRAAQLLMAVMNDYDSSLIEARLDEMHQIEHGADTKKHEMLAVLMKAFMTPIEREDIMLLSTCLDEVRRRRVLQGDGDAAGGVQELQEEQVHP